MSERKVSKARGKVFRTNITAHDVREGVELERDGLWICVHFIKDGEVYFAKGKVGEKYGFASQRMELSQFVQQFNAGRAFVEAARGTK